MAGTFGFRLEKGSPGQVKIEGLREVNKALRDLGDDTKNEMKATHLEAARIVLPEAVRLAPVRTGRLAASLVASATRTGGRITSDRKSTRLNSSHVSESRMPSSA